MNDTYNITILANINYMEPHEDTLNRIFTAINGKNADGVPSLIEEEHKKSKIKGFEFYKNILSGSKNPQYNGANQIIYKSKIEEYCNAKMNPPEMTEHETKILWRLNKSRSQNNVDSVIAEELGITEHDVRVAVDSLERKNYVYQDSNSNQKSENLRAWKITQDGERKVNEIQNRIDIDKNSSTTSRVAWGTIVLSVATISLAAVECWFLKEQNVLLEQQNNIIKQQSTQQLKQDSISNINHTPQNIQIYVSQGKRVKIDTVKIK